MGCKCHPGHVLGCQKPRPCQRSVQQGVRGWSWCASGICSQPLAFHTCAGSSVAPVPVIGVPWELPYVDDLAAMADSLEECIARLKVWKECIERKGLRVNMKKTKFIVLGQRLDLLCDSGAFPCAVCRSGVGVNSIQCSQCIHWVHKKCSGVRGRLAEDPDYVCPGRCGWSPTRCGI